MCLTAILLVPSYPNAQTPPAPIGCWEVVNEGKSVNKIEGCQRSKICAKVVAPRVDGKRPTGQDRGKRVFSGATRDRVDSRVWNGSIYVFQYKVEAEMVLTVESSTVLDIYGCGMGVCDSRKWHKVNCPTN
jgi:hypothetical protein